MATNIRAGLGYIGEEECAEFLGISVGRLRNRLTSGTTPPAYKIGADNVFKVAELHAWVQAQRRGTRRLRSDSKHGPAV